MERQAPPAYFPNSLDSSWDNQDHACCLWGSISGDLPEGILYNNLVVYPNSFKFLSSWGNVDGWGIACYPALGASPVVVRRSLRAFWDPFFDLTVQAMDTSSCAILLGHIRHCTVGCCCHYCDSIADPHPFQRFKNGRNWTFVHNGTIPKSVLLDLIGPEYLVDNPPTGSGVPECDPSDSSKVTDSELFFLLIMKGIEQANYQASDGIRNALIELISRDNGAELNFILSDSYDLWAFCKGNPLNVLYDSLQEYSAIATYVPSQQRGNWRVVYDYTLLHIQAGLPPQSIDLRTYLPPVVSCPGDTSLLYVLARPVCLSGFNADDPDNNLDTIFVDPGTYDKGKICFNPHPGINTIVLTARDHAGNVAVCSTFVDATLSDPGYLAGLVTDSTMFPLPDVMVSMGDIVDSTAIDGRYLIPDLVPGTYRVTYSLPGYSDASLSDVVIAAGDTATIDIVLRFGCFYRPGDSNADGAFNGLDVVYSVNYLKGMGFSPPFECNCPVHGRFYSAADANGNCSFNGLDVTYSVSFLKGMGPAPQGCLECPPAE